jgi:hypothetical protein
MFAVFFVNGNAELKTNIKKLRISPRGKNSVSGETLISYQLLVDKDKLLFTATAH